MVLSVPTWRPVRNSWTTYRAAPNLCRFRRIAASFRALSHLPLNPDIRDFLVADVWNQRLLFAPFDLNPNGRRIRNCIRFLDPDFDFLHAAFGQA